MKTIKDICPEIFIQKWKERDIEKVNSLLISIFLMTNAISWLIPINNISIIILGLVMIAYFLNNKKEIIPIKPILYFIGGIGIWFLISIILTKGMSPNLVRSAQNFVVFGITAFIVSSKKFDEKSIYKYITYISILIIPYVLQNNFFKDYSYKILAQSQKLMVVSYAIVPTIISAGMLLFNKISKLYEKVIAFLVLAIFTYTLISIPIRGAWLVIAVYLYLRIFFFKTNNLRLKIGIIALTIIITLIVLFNITNILIFIRDVMDNLSIENTAIDTIIRKLERDSTNNSRITIYQQALQDIPKSFILGNGIGAFDDKYGYYVHNIVLQIMYEGGIVCLAFFIYVMYKMIRLLLKLPQEKKIFLIFIISISLVQLMLSSYYWYSLKFWFLVGYILNIDYERKEKDHA